MEQTEPHIIHIHKYHHPFNWHLFLLFIPAIAFALTIALMFSSQTKQYALSTEETAVLGETTDK